MIIRRFWEALKMEKSYLLIACLLFLCSSLLGILFWDQVQVSLKEAGIFDRFGEITKRIEETPTFTNVFSIIFFNNLFVSLLTIFSGILFGIFPALIIVNNGIILSAMIMRGASLSNVHPLVLFVTTVLPHGVFELPAIITGAALGMHLGIVVIRSITSLFMKRYKEIIVEWKMIRDRFFWLLIGVIGFLFIAAIIETGLIFLIKSIQ